LKINVTASEAALAVFSSCERALLSGGISDDAIYEVVARMLSKLCIGPTVVDVGCGTGRLKAFLDRKFSTYIGVDLIRYPGLPVEALFVGADLNGGVVPLKSGSAHAVVSIETIEHLENPRGFMRELARITQPGGLIAVTTPNQLSLLSKLGLVLKNEFPAFQEGPGLYPTHLTALLEIDLVRMARECELQETEIAYSGRGRVPGTAWHWPGWCGGRIFSDNVILVARKAVSGDQVAVV
jgi:SAM-dependent methyltransferase